MTRPAALCLSVLVVAACASLPEPSYVPLMGLDRESETAAAADADSVAAAPEAAAADSANALGQSLLFLPFRDESGYAGPWVIQYTVPATLGARLESDDFLHPLPLDGIWEQLDRREREGKIGLERGLELGRQVGADYIVFGQIEDMSMKRFRATVPAGGYRSYEGGTRVTLRPVKVIDEQPAADITREGVEQTKQYGITNPAAFIPYEKEYFTLDQLEWGSEEFNQTLVGISVRMCVDNLAAALDSLISPPPTFAELEPSIIDIDGDQAYINVGLADSVSNGDKYGVWDKGRVLTDPNTDMVLGRALPRRVGVVQVEQVLSEHLSLVRILEGRRDIRTEYTIRAE